MALAAPHDRLSTAPVRGGRTRLVRLGAIGLGAVWAAVAVISVFAPDSVSGSEQDHLPIAAILTWVWGLVASRSLIDVLLAQRAHPDRLRDAGVLVGGVAAVWIVAAAVGVFGPVMVTGSDPTRLPIAAVLAPVAALVLTNTACALFTSWGGPGDRPAP